MQKIIFLLGIMLSLTQMVEAQILNRVQKRYETENLAKLDASNSTPVGYWQKLSEDTGQPEYIVQVYRTGRYVRGKITFLYGQQKNLRCNACASTDTRFQQPLINMDILTSMYLDNFEEQHFTGGALLDPKTGSEEAVTMWLDEQSKNKLNVRTHSGFFYATQTWLRVRRVGNTYKRIGA